jgi:hypothetical protein
VRDASKHTTSYTPDDDGHDASNEGKKADPEYPTHDPATLAFALLSGEP